MSWSISFHASNRWVAKQRVLRDPGLPNLVRALIVDALDNLGTSSDSHPVSVKGHGHQADGRSSQVSACELRVEPLELVHS
jgi:hypothetical protein